MFFDFLLFWESSICLKSDSFQSETELQDFLQAGYWHNIFPNEGDEYRRQIGHIKRSVLSRFHHWREIPLWKQNTLRFNKIKHETLMSNTESGSFSGCNIFCPKNLAEHDNEPSRRSRCTLRHTRNHVLWTMGSFTYSASIILFVLQAGKRRWPLRTSIYKQLPYRYRHPSAARCMSKWQLQIILRKQGIIMLTSADLYTRRPRVWLYHYVALVISITIINDCCFH